MILEGFPEYMSPQEAQREIYEVLNATETEILGD